MIPRAGNQSSQPSGETLKTFLPLFLLLALSLTSSVRAQIYVVDSRGSGQFTDLPQAIAAVPSGAVLRVVAGSYSAFHDSEQDAGDRRHHARRVPDLGRRTRSARG